MVKFVVEMDLFPHPTHHDFGCHEISGARPTARPGRCLATKFASHDGRLRVGEFFPHPFLLRAIPKRGNGRHGRGKGRDERERNINPSVRRYVCKDCSHFFSFSASSPVMWIKSFEQQPDLSITNSPFASLNMNLTGTSKSSTTTNSRTQRLAIISPSPARAFFARVRHFGEVGFDLALLMFRFAAGTLAFA
jgi:hypothetical protein